ncbi:elongation factor P 5-aminopentanone reductase [Cytobacillus sp. Hz8]|uniref:elongation factor P 5-aminopentanone reductase n=1 Tax=Cytobacillus sp. Hz8 TaxID=3347168 RepID=UPI0035E086CC
MNKYILITGASGGIGQAIAKKLAQQGYSLYLHYYKNQTGMERLLEELKEYGGEYIPIKADLASKEGYKELTQNIFSLDGMIHNSGISHYGLVMDLDPNLLEIMMRIHVTSPILVTKELLPKMLSKQAGSIIFISSIWGQIGAACEAAYSAAKGAQIAFMKALSKEVAYNGIRVNAVAPGAIQTAMLEGFTKKELEDIQGEIPMGKLGSAENVADAVNFLLSEQASYMTGQVLSVNGGWFM